MGRKEGWCIASLGTVQEQVRCGDKGASQAKREHAELVVKRADGSIERRDSHGADDPRKKG